MAAGDTTVFNQTKKSVLDKLVDFDSDTIKFALIKDPTGLGSPFSMTAALADPRYGGGGGTDVSAAAVTVAGSWSGPVTLASLSLTVSSSIAVWTHADVSIAGDAANPSTSRWGVYYNDTDAGKRCIAFVDLGTTLDISAGFAYRPGASGVIRLAG
jgi:hypothetical protein